MTRIEKKFNGRKSAGRIAFMPFIVAGDPDFRTSFSIAEKILPYADLLEIGFPYSDPLADGPTIQNADNRALRSGSNTDEVFEFIKKIRSVTDVPITVLAYANIVYQRGIERFYLDAKKAGVDGVLVPDVPVEESGPFVDASRNARIDPIFIVTHTTTNNRLKKILRRAKGYLYVISVLGVTGARSSISPKIPRLIKRIKCNTSLPLAVGFGISERKHLKILKKSGADGAIVGSALIKIIEQNLQNKKVLSRKISAFAREFGTK